MGRPVQDGPVFTERSSAHAEFIKEHAVPSLSSDRTVFCSHLCF